MTKNILVPVVGTSQRSEKSLISAKHHSLRPSIREWEMITHNPERETEREEPLASCDHVTFHIMYYLNCKTSFTYQVEIYWKYLLILWNTRKTSSSQSKVVLYIFVMVTSGGDFILLFFCFSILYTNYFCNYKHKNIFKVSLNTK